MDGADTELPRSVPELRDLIEEVTGQPLTFTAERDRPRTGSAVVVGRVRADRVSGAQAAGLDVDEMTGGTAVGEVDVEVAEQDARLTGGKFGRIGPPSLRPRPPDE